VYEWRGPNSFSSTIRNPEISPATKFNAGMYNVRINVNGCFSEWSLSELVEVIDRPKEADIDIFDGTVCLDFENNSFELCVTEASFEDGAVYTWFNADNGTMLGISSDRCLTITDLSSFSNGINGISVVSNLGNCASLESDPLLIQMNSIPAVSPNAGPDMTLCDEDEAQLAANNFPNLSGMWSSNNPSISFSNVENPNATATGFEQGTNMLVWSLSFQSCVDFASDTIFIFKEISPDLLADDFTTAFNSPIEINLIINDIIPELYDINLISQPSFGELQIIADGVYNFDPGGEFEGAVTFEYEICNTICPELCDIATVTINIGDDNTCTIPNIITPNGDGMNDIFTIPCLNSGAFPANKLLIFNQWGDQVHKSAPYNNDWEGTYQGSLLPVGTYFYIFDPGNGEQPNNGFLIIEN